MKDSQNEPSTNAPPVEILEADLSLPEHQEAVVALVNAYAADPMGNGRPLDEKVRRELIPGLRNHPATLIFLARCGGEYIGIAVCFTGFSTFAARPLINIHDLAVLPACRGQRVGRLLLGAIEEKARTMDCCKITLEVLENNRIAMRLYRAAGFSQAIYTEEAGGALFYAKSLKRI
jgi:ribosomal protein S18 acetylase RimI-like enzyme